MTFTFGLRSREQVVAHAALDRLEAAEAERDRAKVEAL